ncbi:MAG: hypothetical protein SO131_01735, partial [Prevotella sp.]|nr:hypothetical protein [Prevotella sp.]
RITKQIIIHGGVSNNSGTPSLVISNKDNAVMLLCFSCSIAAFLLSKSNISRNGAITTTAMTSPKR